MFFFCWCRYVAVFESVHASCEERLEMASFSVLIRISWLQTCPWTGPASWLVESGELWTNQSAPGILAWQWRAASLENSRERQTPPDTQVERGPSEFVRSQEFASKAPRSELWVELFIHMWVYAGFYWSILHWFWFGRPAFAFPFYVCLVQVGGTRGAPLGLLDDDTKFSRVTPSKSDVAVASWQGKGCIGEKHWVG